MSHDHRFLVISVYLHLTGGGVSLQVALRDGVCTNRRCETSLGLPATAVLQPERKEKLSHSVHCTTDHTTLWAAHSDTPPAAVSCVIWKRNIADKLRLFHYQRRPLGLTDAEAAKEVKI